MTLGIGRSTARGLFFLAFGALGVWLCRGLEVGTTAEMGVGFVPRALSFGCIIVGTATLAARLVRGPDDDSTRVSLALKPLAIVTALVVAFAALLPWLGLPLTIVAIVLLAAGSGETFRISTLLATALLLAIVTTLLFHTLLKLQIPIWPALKGIV